MPDDSTPGDPVAVILARVEVKLDNALTEQARHSTRIDELAKEQSTQRDRITTLEASKPKNVPAWVATAVAFAALVASFITPLIRA